MLMNILYCIAHLPPPTPAPRLIIQGKINFFISGGKSVPEGLTTLLPDNLFKLSTLECRMNDLNKKILLVMLVK